MFQISLSLNPPKRQASLFPLQHFADDSLRNGFPFVDPSVALYWFDLSLHLCPTELLKLSRQNEYFCLLED